MEGVATVAATTPLTGSAKTPTTEQTVHNMALALQVLLGASDTSRKPGAEGTRSGEEGADKKAQAVALQTLITGVATLKKEAEEEGAKFNLEASLGPGNAKMLREALEKAKAMEGKTEELAPPVAEVKEEKKTAPEEGEKEGSPEAPKKSGGSWNPLKWVGLWPSSSSSAEVVTATTEKEPAAKTSSGDEGEVEETSGATTSSEVSTSGSEGEQEEAAS